MPAGLLLEIAFLKKDKDPGSIIPRMIHLRLPTVSSVGTVHLTLGKAGVKH